MSFKSYRTAIFATIIGNCMEWFDYALIGYLAPRYLDIYPSENAAINPLFFIYAAGLIGRPIGGVLFGYLGDIHGRRLILILSISLMATGALFTALLPSLFSFSLLTPMLLLLILLVHNLSAGGETPGTVAYLYESFPKRLRPFALSWVNFGFFLGVFLSTVDFSSLYWELKESVFLDWGWRLPFIFSAFIGFIGLAFRRRLHESPQFSQMKHDHDLVKNPFKILWRDYKKECFLGTGLLTLHTVALNTLVIFNPSYFQTFLKRTPDETLTLSVFCMMIGLLATPFSGFLTLKFPAKKILKLCLILITFMTWPLYLALQSKSITVIFFANSILTFICASYSAIIPSFICDLFPSNLRCSGYSICRNLPIPILTGLIPLLFSYLIAKKGYILCPAYAIIIAAVISLICFLLSQEKKESAFKKALT
jgi:MHS family proline/betaine transporter-like MFS transporter